MNAKSRYRQRLKLQAALARVLEVLADNVAGEIPPNRGYLGGRCRLAHRRRKERLTGGGPA
jgi:hypothetical protein